MQQLIMGLEVAKQQVLYMHTVSFVLLMPVVIIYGYYDVMRFSGGGHT